MRKRRGWFAGMVVCALACGCSSMAPQSRAKIYAVGEPAAAGHLVYTVLETEWMDQLGQPPNARTAQHRFLVVKVAVANTGSELLSVPELRLEDGRGAVYGELTNGAGVADWLGSLRQLKPRQTERGAVAFDAPIGSYRLRVANYLSAEEEISALVELPLELTPKTPESSAPAQQP